MCGVRLTQGLRPGLCGSIALTGLIYVFPINTLYETIALCGTRCVIIDIQTPSFTRVNSLRLQPQRLAITAFCKAPQKGQVLLVLLETVQRSLYYFDTLALAQLAKFTRQASFLNLFFVRLRRL